MNLPALLGRLEEARLLHRAEDEGGYAFNHSLIQEAAYTSLLRRERRRIHRAVGQALEQEHAGSLPEAAPILASHFEEAGDDGLALRYGTIAGDAALRVYALPEAIDHFTRALEIAARLREVPPEDLLHLYASRGHSLELASRLDEALSNYEAMEKESLRTGDPRAELDGRMARAGIYAGSSDRHDAVLAERLGSEALALARALGDPAAEARALWILVILYSFSGRPEDAAALGEQSLAIAREHGLREQEAFTLTDIYRVYATLGRYEEAAVSLARAQELWRERANPPMLADTLSTSVFNDGLRGNYEQAIASAREAQRISKEIGNLWGQTYSRMWVGRVYLERGEVSTAVATWQQSIELSGPSGFPGPLVFARTDQAMFHADIGQLALGTSLAEQALAAADRHFPKYRGIPCLALAWVNGLKGHWEAADRSLAESARALVDHDQAAGILTARFPVVAAELALKRGDFAEAMRQADEQRRLREVGIRAPLPYLLLIRGLALLRQGDIHGARQALEGARAESEAIGSRWALWRVLHAGARAAEHDGDKRAAERWSAEGRAVASYIADHMGDESLREAFLSIPEVRELLGAP